MPHHLLARLRSTCAQCLVLLSAPLFAAPTAPPPDCQNWTLVFRTDAAGHESTWRIINTSDLSVVASGGPYASNYTYQVPICLTAQTCYSLRVEDSGGNGMPGKGYVLLDPEGRRVIDNAGNGAGFTSISEAPEPFCSPVGTDRPIDSRCDMETWLATETLYASENPSVSAQWGIGDPSDDGYQFWFFDPHGGYSRKVFRSHADPGGQAPADAIRATKLHLSSIVTNPLPSLRLLNVRIRGRVNGVDLPWGPACRFKIDPTAAMCRPTQLIPTPGPTLSCGRSGLLLDGSSMIWAIPVTRPTNNGGMEVANRYRFRFENASENYARNIATGSYWLTLTTWATLPLQYSQSYDVTVQASFDGGVTWCPWGPKCRITMAISSSAGMAPGPSLPAELDLWPVPNPGDVLHVTLRGDHVMEGDLDIRDLSGRTCHSERIRSGEDGEQIRVPLPADLPPGVYIVSFRSSERTTSKRLIIAR